MKKFIPLLISAVIIVGIFVFFYIMLKLNIVLNLPPFDSVTLPNLKAFSDWLIKSAATLSILGNLFQWLQKKAILSEDTIDNKVLTYLINFFSMQWFKGLTETNKKEETKNE